MKLIYFLMLAIFFLFVVRQMRQGQNDWTLNQWRKKLDMNLHEATFNDLYAEVDGFALSKAARLKQDAMEYVYGEIEFTPFVALLSLAKPDHETVFYDLGSGTGKAVFACAMVFKVKKSCGIELFPALHDAAVIRLQQLQLDKKYLSHSTKALCFINANFLEVDFNDATLIFINATAYFGPTWIALNQKLEQLQTPVTVITTSKKLLSSVFSVIQSTWIEMSWGHVVAYIQTNHTS